MLQKTEAFDDLVLEVQGCALCASMAGCTRVLSWANGAPGAPIMFVGEAPGRLGADRTAIPFHGDVAGDNFEKLIALAGLSRKDVFVTNAVLCNPKDDKGNNAPPSKLNLRNCAHNLRKQIEVIRPSLVVTLGAAALEATKHIEPHSLSLATHVRTTHRWNGVTLLPLYHPGARAMIHRNFADQSADYYFVGETVRRLGRTQRTPRPMAKADDRESWDIVNYLIMELGELSLFRLHKSMYLTDYYFQQSVGRTASNFVYIRQKDGPYCVELGSRWFKAFEEKIRVFVRDGRPHLAWRHSSLFDNIPRLPSEIKLVTDRVLVETRTVSDSNLKTKVYLTKPMKTALRFEHMGSPQLNKPLL